MKRVRCQVLLFFSRFINIGNQKYSIFVFNDDSFLDYWVDPIAVFVVGSFVIRRSSCVKSVWRSDGSRWYWYRYNNACVFFEEHELWY